MKASENIRQILEVGYNGSDEQSTALSVALDLLEKKEQNRIIEVPVRIGGEYYYIARDRRRGIKKVKVVGIWTSCDEKYSYMHVADVEGTFSTQCDFDEIGIRLFETREEAEEAIEGIEK